MKIATTPEKSHPLSASNPPSKSSGPVKPLPSLWKFGWRFNPPPSPPPFPAERGDAHYVYRTDISHRHVTIKQIIPNKLLLNHFTHESKNLSQKNRRKAFIVWISSSEPLIASVFFLKMYKILQMFETLQHFKNTRTFCEKFKYDF